jgi:hypothetical protein
MAWGPGVRGTIDFVHDTAHDIVIEHPRWKLDTPVEVMRWYQLQAGYFGGRFKERKDIVVVDDGFDVTPQVGTLWGQYRARLHELYVRFFVRVGGGPRVRLATNTSAVRYSISAVEKPTLEEAIAFIMHAREEAEKEKVGSGSRGRFSKTTHLSTAMPKASES